MQYVSGVKKLYYDVIDDVCKELMNENADLFKEPNFLYSLREDWLTNFENLSVENKNEQYTEEEEDSAYSSEMMSDEDVFEEEIDIAEAEKVQNVYVVCLFVKVVKHKGKWKCIFKDGFVNIEGYEDYPFNTATGELDW
ncbi:TOA1 [Ecytonucleospora hepatopenaei]|uniref:TOA1 n=1 Tax=Ecytonucleospora hepatopenaei TaxID=646526 RepID=A0A1W0E910_9MICR|nr:TOA1 [Ecytonucleospora hepatopenaei]